MNTSEFLALLFGLHPSGHIALTFGTYGLYEKKLRIAGTELFPIGAVDAAGVAACQHAETQDVFFGLALVEKLSGFRTKNRDAIGLPGLWIDLDVAHLAHAGEQLPPTETDALSLFAADLPEHRPTFVVHSGHGLHAYCLFEEPWMLLGDTDRRAAKELVKRYQDVYRQRAITRGWGGVDPVHDLSRILRPVGTWNRKILHEPKLVDLYIGGGPWHRLRDWQRRLGSVLPQASVNMTGLPPSPGLSTVPYMPQAPPNAPQAAQTPPNVSQAVQAPPSAFQVAPVPLTPPAPVLARETLAPGLTLLDYVHIQMRLTKEEKKRQAVELLLTGQPLPAGERNSTMYLLVSMAAWWALHVKPDTEPEDLYPLFAASVAAMAAVDRNPNNPPPDERTVLDQLARALSDTASALEAKWAEQDAAISGLRASALRRGGADWFRKEVGARSPQDLNSGYLPEDLERFAASQNCTVADFRQRWILQWSSNYFFYENGRYVGPFPSVVFQLGVRDFLVNAPLEMFTLKADGKGTRKKKMDEIVHDYGSIIAAIELSNSIEHTFYDPVTCIFHERCHKLRDLQPERSPNVEHWLNLLSYRTEERERLLDWIATLTFLDRQSCAIYLCGPKSVGKTLLVAGLSRLWTEDGPVDYDALMASRFSDALTRSPLISIDEGVGWSHNHKTVSTILRRLIGNSSHAIDRKGLPVCQLHGNLRVVISGNNAHILNDVHDHMEALDIAAFAERLLFLEMSPRAREFLDHLGGPEMARRWVDGDQIARHALWLRDVRGKRTTARFLVQGLESAVHRSLATSSQVSSAVCDFLASFLMNPKPVELSDTNAILYGNGHLLVSSRSVCQHWRQYVSYDKDPTTQAVGRALGAIARGPGIQSRRIGGGRYYDVDRTFVTDWMDANNVGASEIVAEKVQQAQPDWGIDEEGKLRFNRVAGEVKA